MSHAHLRNAIAATVLGAALATPAAALPLLGPSCLEKLTAQTRAWAECTERFDRVDNRCRQPAAKMNAYMQECASKGKSKARIDAAMTEGYRQAGKRPVGAKGGTPKPPATTQSPATMENVLSKYAQEPRSAQ